MNFTQLIIAPLFFAIPFGLTRRRGDRLLGALTLYACYAFILVVLFGGQWLAHLLIMAVLYGVRVAWSGSLRIVRGRHFIELSNGDVYRGFGFFLWCLIMFACIAGVGVAFLRTGRWLYRRSPLLRRVAARCSEVFENHKLPR